MFFTSWGVIKPAANTTGILICCFLDFRFLSAIIFIVLNIMHKNYFFLNIKVLIALIVSVLSNKKLHTPTIIVVRINIIDA